jgi:uncharacterized protein (TIGR01244 family)
MLNLILLVSLLQAPEKQTLPGATNVTRVGATVMCGGATTSEAFPAIKRLGFTSVINLRPDGEPGVDIAAARTAAAAAGLRYVHVPVHPAQPSSESVEAFLKAVTDPANEPMYIHCGSANRVAALWMIKRVVIDNWELARASDEASAIGLTSPGLKKFALDYLESRTH